RVLAADPREVGAGALRAPLVRAVVHGFAGDRVRTVALRFGAQRADHLRVAGVTAFAHLDVLAREAQRIVGLCAVARRDRVRLDEQWRDLGEPTERHHDRREDAELAGVLLDRFEVFVTTCHAVLLRPAPGPVPAPDAVRAREWARESA